MPRYQILIKAEEMNNVEFIAPENVTTLNFILSLMILSGNSE